MPRDANGNYTLPSGNPVLSNTLIASVWANDTMSDLANEMQDSLSRSGKGGFTAPVGVVDKSGSIPGINFASEPTSGFKREGAGDLRIQVLGQDNARFLSTNRATDVWNNDLSTPAWERVFTTPAANVLDGNVEKTVQIKRETTPATVPGSIAAGELGVNIGDDPPTLYVGDGVTPVPFINPDFVRFPSGTKVLFYQDVAPTGWTIDSAVDEHAISLTKGLAASGIEGGTVGGINAFSSQFAAHAEGATYGVGNRALSVSNMPAHGHGGGIHGHGLTNGTDVMHAGLGGSRLGSGSGGGSNTVSVNNSGTTILTEGGGVAHGHTIDLNVARAHCIIAVKD